MIAQRVEEIVVGEDAFTVGVGDACGFLVVAFWGWGRRRRRRRGVGGAAGESGEGEEG